MSTLNFILKKNLNPGLVIADNRPRYAIWPSKNRLILKEFPHFSIIKGLIGTSN